MKSIIYLVLICVTGFFNPTLAQETQTLDNKQARKSPDWLTKGVIYQIQPRAFTNEGTIKAATARLKNLAELGVTIAYLCPVFTMDGDMDQVTWSKRQKASGMNNPYNPYRIKDYYHVDPEFGSDKDLKDFVKEAHRLGLKVMLDMVYLHTGSKAVFLKDNPDFIKRGADGKPMLAEWNWPMLNFENPKLRQFLLDNMKYWVRDYGVDGFRCDASDHVPLDFWENSRTELEKVRPDIAMLAEGHRVGDQLKAFDVNYSYSLYSSLGKIFKQNATAATLQMAHEKEAAGRPVGARFIRFIDQHDTSNNDWYNRIDESWGAKGVDAGLLLAFTLDGVPFLYNGQDKARHSIFGKLTIHWTLENTDEGRQRLKFLKDLTHLYRKEPALITGNIKWVKSDAAEEVVSFIRELDGRQILTIVNLKSRKLGVRIETQQSADVLLSSGASWSNSKSAFELEGFGYWVGTIKNQQ